MLMNSVESKYSNALPTHSDSYLYPVVRRILEANQWPDKRAIEIGCANGVNTNRLVQMGFQVVGIDVSQSGIDLGRKAFPAARFEVGSVYDDLKGKYGTFPLVLCLQVAPVILHPRVFANTIMSLIAPGGLAIVSTGFHGYWKNLALALSGRMDQHFTVLWENGLIKFYSVKTFSQLFSDAGASRIDIDLAGRIPALAKSIVATVRP